MKLNSMMAVVACVLAAACATTGATYRSGVAPKLFEHAPYYAGAAVTPGASRIAHLRVRYQLGAEQPAIFEPKADSGSPAAQLVADMNRYLDSLGISVSTATSGAEPGTPPDVKFSCRTSPVGSCLDQDDDDAGYQRLELSVGRPSLEWTTWAASALDAAGASQALVITLELGQNWVRQKSWASLSKEVRLGTNYDMPISWATALDKPIGVVQLTGALIGRDGRAIRIGAEGLVAKRTNLLVGAFGAEAMVTDEDIAKLRTLRREDLPNRPLVWQVALRNLASQLTGGVIPFGDQP
jgi:hypothetical protein